MGDLIVTCTSGLSRNHTVGERLGRGEKIDQILAGMKQVAEGVTTASTARALALTRQVDAPIVEQVCALIHDNKNPQRAVEDLMLRNARPERD
jgi:glycerol-3-phosphate dehydrogenase (NAD(P)+)